MFSWARIKRIALVTQPFVSWRKLGNISFSANPKLACDAKYSTREVSQTLLAIVMFESELQESSMCLRVPALNCWTTLAFLA